MDNDKLKYFPEPRIKEVQISYIELLDLYEEYTVDEIARFIDDIYDDLGIASPDDTVALVEFHLENAQDLGRDILEKQRNMKIGYIEDLVDEK